MTGDTRITLRSRVIRALMGVVGVGVGLVARAWLGTLRVEVRSHPLSAQRLGDPPRVFAFWHGRQWPLFAWKRPRPMAVLVSHSRDGCLQAKALYMQGLTVVRGSSSNGGAAGLVAIVRMLQKGMDAAFAVDGPRGPLGRVKGGVVAAARLAGATLVPVGAAIEKGVVLARAWDRYALAWPFSRVRIVLGAPIDAQAQDARAQLELAIAEVNDEAERWREGERREHEVLPASPQGS